MRRGLDCSVNNCGQPLVAETMRSYSAYPANM